MSRTARLRPHLSRRVPPPEVNAPPPFRDRRTELRRASDRAAYAETALLARALDVLADEHAAEARLGAILRLLAETVGARRAALLAVAPERRIAVHFDPTEDPGPAEALAAWLDATGPRSRAERAAAVPALITFAVTPHAPASARAPSRSVPSAPATEPHRILAMLPGDVLLAFDLDAAPADDLLTRRLPEPLARDAAVMLALATRDLARERELAVLAARDAERSRFVATVAHELRTPLTGLGGYLDLLIEGKVDDPAVELEFLERGRGIVESIAGLVGDLLEVSRLDAGSLTLDVEPFSIADVGMRVVAALDPIGMERGIELRSDLPSRMRMALGDRRRVQQILTNLVGNSLKFVPVGGHVELAAWIEGPTVVVAVRDDGRGIGPDDRPRIFERFYRMAAHEQVTGTGLGLPIARDLARAMGGDLDVASVPGAGSAFVLVLGGQRGADPGSIADVLAATLAAEEIALEERAVLAALAAAGRSLPQRRRTIPLALVPGTVPAPALEVGTRVANDERRDAGDHDADVAAAAVSDRDPAAEPAGIADVGSGPRDRRPKLRALPGGGMRAPSPA